MPGYATAKRRNRLPPLERALLAAQVVLAVHEGWMDEKQAGAQLRSAMRVQWSLLTALQYLSGQEAIAVITGLPDGWERDGMTKETAAKAVLIAGLACAFSHPGGATMSAGHLVNALRQLPLDSAPKA